MHSQATAACTWRPCRRQGLSAEPVAEEGELGHFVCIDLPFPLVSILALASLLQAQAESVLNAGGGSWVRQECVLGTEVTLLSAMESHFPSG